MRIRSASLNLSINSFSLPNQREILRLRMIFLPILERELRVRARNPVNYWGRFGMAGVGVLVCTPSLMSSGPFGAPGAIGRSAFNGLVSAAFLVCCAACVFTADTISSERREGTLGLLLLTRVRHFDVLLGKLASSGLLWLTGLIAFLPVLTLPLLAGGVTGGEAVRKAVALIMALFLALSVGLWASARGLDRFRTSRAALLTLAGVVLGPPLLGVFAEDTHAWIASPLGTLIQASDLNYKKSAGEYWLSLGLVQLVGCAFLFGANTWMVRSRTAAAGEAVKEPARAISATPPVTRTIATQTTNATVAESKTIRTVVMCRYCGRANDANATFCRECGTVLRPLEPKPPRMVPGPTPLHWLLRRQGGLKPMLWLAAVTGFFHFSLFGMIGRFLGGGAAMFVFGISGALGLAMSVITGSIFAWAASRFFVEARRSGELELLLTTPVGATEIVSAQWDMLQRQLRWPVGVMMLPALLQGTFFLLSYNPIRSSLWTLYTGLSTLLIAGNVILSVGALSWLALWFGLRMAGQARAILWTVLLANGVPYLISLIWSILYPPVFRLLGAASSGSPFGTPWLLGYLIPQMVNLLLYLGLIRRARWHLLRELAGAEPLDPRQILSFSNLLPGMAAATRRARQWPGV